ncbi:MAG: class I SAM-dependent methyltransferase [Thermaurantiacus sp.]
MTTREATRPLALSDRSNGIDSRTPSDRLFTFLWGAVQWPWLLRSLSPGRPQDRQALLASLQLPADALPVLGSWKADAGFLRMVASHVARYQPETVVEFGCGASTLVLARALELAGGGVLISHDQHLHFVEATRAWLEYHGLGADIRHAPLLAPPPPWRGAWYGTAGLPTRIDLLLIDGPHWGVHPFARGAAETLFPRLAIGGTVLLDDGARPGERVVLARWRRRWPDMRFALIHAGPKGTVVGERLR